MLTQDASSPNQLRASTVDRFQGDEADVVIASLVVDEKTRTQFVKVQNRMIVRISFHYFFHTALFLRLIKIVIDCINHQVLLSRARLGCFILGNLGYFNHAGGAKHWMNTFAILEKPPESSDNSEAMIAVNDNAMPGKTPDSEEASYDENTLTTTRKIALIDARYTGARVGSSFPLCCPQHPLMSCFDAKTANDLDLGFCQIACDEKLACSHNCGLKCH